MARDVYKRQDQTDANWDAVVSAFVDGWATEYQLANGQQTTEQLSLIHILPEQLETCLLKI